MKIVYAKQDFPDSWRFAVFLAGPTPRDQEVPSWRPDALAWLKKHALEMGLSDLVVFVPEDESGEFQGSYIDQVEWEAKGLNFADVIMFWIPRDLEWLPGYTTNVEFGKWCSSAKAVLGHPKDAPKTRYLDWLASANGMPTPDQTLEDLCKTVLEQHPGAEVDTFREGGERYVPLLVWQTPMFQDWIAAHKACGNRLDEAEVRWVFHMPKLGKVFSWVLGVKIWVHAENRWKENEWVFSRSDISTVVLWSPASDHPIFEGGGLEYLLDTKVILVREFRSPVRNDACFVYEVPGGSSPKDGQDPLQVASEEVHEETGLIISKDRFRALGSRQLAATLSTHQAHLFVAQLSRDEMKQAMALADAGVTHGVEEDSEITYVDVRTLREMLYTELVDWSVLGMVFKGVLDRNPIVGGE